MEVALNFFADHLRTTDDDEDGDTDTADNCVLVANSNQRDTNSDGFGNLCDPDLNNDCFVNFVDHGMLQSVFFTSDANADLDGNGSVDFADLGILQQYFFKRPGPSGTTECPLMWLSIARGPSRPARILRAFRLERAIDPGARR
jgi:hypothetical protein